MPTEDEELDALLGPPPDSNDVAPAYLEASKRTPLHLLTEWLPEIERMAAQGMGVRHMAHRIGMPLSAFMNHYNVWDDVYAAVNGGAARGVDEISSVNYRKAARGDSAAISLYLKTKGGFTTAAERGEAVAVSLDSPASVTIDHVSEIADRQRALAVRS